MSHKISRNDPCPCGSGKKYKQCCLMKTAHDTRPTGLKKFKAVQIKNNSKESGAAPSRLPTESDLINRAYGLKNGNQNSTNIQPTDAAQNQNKTD